MTAEPRARYSRIGILGFWLCISLPVNADTGPESEASNLQAVEQSTTQQIESRTSRAEQWGLEPGEWQRYESLMQGIRGSVSPATLSPL